VVEAGLVLLETLVLAGAAREEAEEEVETEAAAAGGGGAPRSLWPAAAVRVAAGVCTSTSIEQACVARLLRRLKQARCDGPLLYLLWLNLLWLHLLAILLWLYLLAILTMEQARRDGPLLRYLQSHGQAEAVLAMPPLAMPAMLPCL
tara:strand:+ start:309 stop:749 length:441 start_codon:yes stop_codon:yes gene_type:complete